MDKYVPLINEILRKEEPIENFALIYTIKGNRHG